MSKFATIHAQTNHKPAVHPQVLQDLDPQWLRVTRRMQSVAKSRGVQIITMSVVVNAEGVPEYWFTPRILQVEPAASAAEFLRVLLGMEGKGLIDNL